MRKGLPDRADLFYGSRKSPAPGVEPVFPEKDNAISYLPIAIIPCTPIHTDNPGPVPIVVPVIVISVVMPSIIISVIPSTVIISRCWRRNKTGNTERHSKH